MITRNNLDIGQIVSNAKRDFLTTFVSSCIAYGMIVEQERMKRLNDFKEKNVDVSKLSFAIFFAM